MLTLLMMLAAFDELPANWTKVSSGGKATTYIDKSSVRNIGPTVRTAWVRRQMTEPDSDGVIYKVAKVRYDCANEESGLMAITTYGFGGKVINFENYKASAVNMTPQAPGSVGLETLSAVCKM